MKRQRILIVEDDSALNNGIALSLRSGEIEIIQAFDLKQTRQKLNEDIDLVILDINLPDGNGLDFYREMKQNRNIPVIFLTANDMESDIVMGLELGADDYITKPFSLAVLRARVNAVLRRQVRQEIRQIGNLKLDFERMQFRRDGVQLELSKTEQKLLRILVENQGITLSRAYLIDRVWSDEAEFVEENALSVTIKRLRAKIEDNPRQPKYIKTIFGIGYQWGNLS